LARGFAPVLKPDARERRPMMALLFVVLVLAALVAMLGFRKSSVIVWGVAMATTLYVLWGHITTPLKIVL
jgi:hypothetical protein